MEYHARTFYIEGLDLGEERFVWNNKLMIMDGGTKNGNIAVAHVLLERSISDIGASPDAYVEKESRIILCRSGI